MRRSPALLVGVALLAAAAALAWANALGMTPIDDAFITFRAARNWAHGLGPVFNPGERVESASSPVWTALFALGECLGVAPPALMPVLALVLVAVAAMAAARLALDLSGVPAAILSAIVLAALPAWSAWALTGMEVPVAGATLVLAAIFARTASTPSRAAAAGLFGALAALSRPECLALQPLIFWLVARSDRRRGLIALVWMGIPLLAFFAFRWTFFGTLVPNTYVAKRMGLGLAGVVRGVRYVLGFSAVHAPIALAVCVALIRRGPARPVAAFCALFAAAVAWEGGDHLPLGRMLAPTLPLAVPIFAAEVVKLRVPVRVVALGSLVATVVAAPDLATFNSARIGVPRLEAERIFVELTRDVGVAARALPPGRLASVPIGAIGWFSDRNILDLVGLADARIARSPHLQGVMPGHDHADVDYVIAQRPELVLLVPQITIEPLSDAAEARWLEVQKPYFLSALLLAADPRFQAGWHPASFRSPSGERLRVWVRNDLLP